MRTYEIILHFLDNHESAAGDVGLDEELLSSLLRICNCNLNLVETVTRTGDLRLLCEAADNQAITGVLRVLDALSDLHIEAKRLADKRHGIRRSLRA